MAARPTQELLAPSAPPRRWRAWARLGMRSLAAGLLVPILIAAVAEGFARLRFLPSIGSVLEHEPYRKLVLTQAPRGIQTPTAFTTNRWGMRGGEPPRDWSRWDTWIAMGSSTTLCYHLDDHKTWPYLLQERLQEKMPLTWVGNAGQDGVTSNSGVYFMDNVIRRLRPDGVLLLVGGSDLALAFSDDRRERGSPYDRAFEKRMDRELDKTSVRERFRLYRAWKLRQRRLAAYPDTLAQSAHKSRFPAPLSAPEDSLPADSLIAGPLQRFGQNLLRMQALANGLGIRAVFLTHPYLYGADSAWAARESRTVELNQRDYRISAATERALLDRFNAATLSLCAAHRLECFDLAPLIPNDSLHFYDEGHFTEKGAALAAEKIAGYLLEHPVGP
jgi:lysophospholipase L1-like esterase